MLVTHNMCLIAKTADRVAMTYIERVIDIGAVDEVIPRSLYPYAAGLMASIPSLNRKAGRLSRIEGRCRAFAARRMAVLSIRTAPRQATAAEVNCYG